MHEVTHGCVASPPAGSRQLLCLLQPPLPAQAKRLFSLQRQYRRVEAFVLGSPVCFPYGGFLWSCRHGSPGQAARQGRDGAGCCCEPMPPDGSILPAPPRRTPEHREKPRRGSGRSPPITLSSKPLLFLWFSLLFCTQAFPQPFKRREEDGRAGGRRAARPRRRHEVLRNAIEQALGETPEIGDSPHLSLKEMGCFWKTHPSQTSYRVQRRSNHVEFVAHPTGWERSLLTPGRQKTTRTVQTGSELFLRRAAEEEI